MGVLSKAALEGIAAYKYKSGSYTYLDLQLNHFWNAMVEFLPMWMAPNLVTLTGTIIVAASTAILLHSCPQMESGAPGWTYVVCGVGLFLYQTLDAIDGKQARRTGSSSPLGQLFDHGCDALSALLNCLAACVLFRIGTSVYTFIGLTGVSANFFCAQWDEYHTGTMSCGNGYYGVTEGQLTLIFCLLFTAVIGDQFWAMQPLPFAAFTCGELFIATCFTSNIVLIYTNVKNVFTAAPLKKDELGNKDTSKIKAIMQLIPMIITIAGGYFTMFVGPLRQVYLDYPLILIVPFGLNFVLMSSRMIVCHMSKVPYTMQFRILVPLTIFLGLVYAPSFNYVSPLVAACVYMVATIGIYTHYILCVVFEICAHLKINLLTLSPPSPKKSD